MDTLELPVYLYGTNMWPERGDGALYHYTKFDSFLKILESMSLKLSSYKNLNDLNEANVANLNWDKNVPVYAKLGPYIQEKCGLLCFSQNYQTEYGVQEGTNHPAMWAHYGENSEGVCIVIDKAKFIKTNKEVFDNHFYKFENIKYGLFNTLEDQYIKDDVTTPEAFIEANWKGLFYLKHLDWKYEDEHRLFIMDFNGMLSIDGCIKHIVLGRKVFLNDSKIKKIMDRVVNPNYKCYRKLIPYSFATAHYGKHGYDTMMCEDKIYNLFKQSSLDKLYADYQSWLKTIDKTPH